MRATTFYAAAASGVPVSIRDSGGTASGVGAMAALVGVGTASGGIGRATILGGDCLRLVIADDTFDGGAGEVKIAFCGGLGHAEVELVANALAEHAGG